MRNATFVVSILVLSVLLSGCVVVSSNKTQSASPQKTKENSGSQNPRVKATLAEIDAASKLTSQSARANVYKAIANRPGLSPEERIHLINAITMHLTSQTDREEVLLVLVNNYPTAVPRIPKEKPSPEQSTHCTAEKP